MEPEKPFTKYTICISELICSTAFLKLLTDKCKDDWASFEVSRREIDPDRQYFSRKRGTSLFFRGPLLTTTLPTTREPLRLMFTQFLHIFVFVYFSRYSSRTCMSPFKINGKMWKVLIPETNTDIDQHIAHVFKYPLFLSIKMSLLKMSALSIFPWGFRFFYLTSRVYHQTIMSFCIL